MLRVVIKEGSDRRYRWFLMSGEDCEALPSPRGFASPAEAANAIKSILDRLAAGECEGVYTEEGHRWWF